MKKLIALLLVLAMLVLATGCQQKAADKPAATASQDSAVSEIQTSISDASAVQTETDVSDLDTLDADLANI